jgi:hypothetical protein
VIHGIYLLSFPALVNDPIRFFHDFLQHLAQGNRAINDSRTTASTPTGRRHVAARSAASASIAQFGGMNLMRLYLLPMPPGVQRQAAQQMQ